MLLQSIWLQCVGAAMAVWVLVFVYFFSTYIVSSLVGSASDVSSTTHQQQLTKTSVSSSADSSIDIKGSSNDSCNAQDDINNCNAQDTDTSNKWRWEPTSKDHPCTINRISHTELHSLFGDTGLPNLYPYPLVIYPDDDEWKEQRLKFTNLTTLDNLPTNFPADFKVTLTGSDSLSTHRRSIPLKQYLDEEVLNANNGSGITAPDKLGNETWYLFGETFTEDWTAFLKHYDPLPPCASCTPLHQMQGMVALSFGIGNIGSGVQWHLHGPGFSETIHGRKHWVLYPPEYRPSYNLDYASRHWMEYTYPDLKDWTDTDMQIDKKAHTEFYQRWKNRHSIPIPKSRRDKGRMIDIMGIEQGTSSKKPWECIIHEGEMIYFPDQWHHATINLEKYTVFVSSFTTEHEK